jgi:peptidoglycan glycosyltransferase
MGRRIRWLGVVLIVCFTLVMLQLVNVQFRQANALDDAAHNPRVIAERYTETRGAILAGDGSVLAQSLATKSGLYKYQRDYPTKSLFADIVGYDSYIYGMSGVEQQYNQYLQSHHEAAHDIGQVFNPTTGVDDVTLTVSPTLQKLAQQELAGRDGAVVVLNPTTGAVEAMYSNPSFDPTGLTSPLTKVENLSRLAQLTKDADGFNAYNNMATQQTFAPGSTFKTITSSAVYDYKPALASKYYPVQSCISLPNSNKALCNDGNQPCGGTLQSMLPQSCDPGYGAVGLDLGGKTLSKQAARFGFNQVPPIDLPATFGSVFPASEVQNPANGAFLAYSAIGQKDVQATALQMGLVAAGIADGGVIMTPHVMSMIHDANGNLVKSYTPTPWMRATSQQAAAQVTSLMEGVVTSGTAAQVGFPPQDQVAAKTGTAQTGNAQQQTHDWMIAFAPASNPKVAVAVVVPFQPFSFYGATVAGPIVNAMIQAALAQQPGKAKR